MLSRPNSRIRRLIPGHRRARSDFESKAQSDSDECPELEERDRRKDSWYIRRPKQPLKPTRATSVRGAHAHDVFGPNKTPRSSDSSLCSCGHNEDFASQSNTLRRPCLCILSSKNRRSDDSLQIPGNAICEEDGHSSERSPKSRHTDSPGLIRSSEESAASTSSSDPREVSDLIPEEDIARRSSEQIETQLPPEEYSDDIQKLIQEADEAFKAVGSALADVKIARYSSNEDTPRAATFEEPPMSGSFVDRPGPPTPDISPILQSPLRPIPQPRANTTFIPGPTRNSSVSKRKKSKKQIKSPKIKSPKTVKARKPIVNKAPIKHAPRWTLTENVTELFSGRLFNKVEADEMLTEAQLEEFKRRRLSDLKIQQANETSKSLDSKAAAAGSASEEFESIDTPIEPFHLEDLPSRIGSAGVKLTAETPVEEKKVNPTFFYDDDPETPDFSLDRDRDELFLDELSSSASAGLENRSASNGGGSSSGSGSGNSRSPFTVPSKKNLKGLMATGRKQPPRGLASIPEAAGSAPRTPMDELFLDKQQQQLGGNLLQDSVADSDYVYLRSSPCTLTAPRFRHGPIRVAKSDLIPEPSLGADDGLDWTAFQMAILGGAGDWNSESDDTIHRRTVEEMDELVEWWESWGFESSRGLGGLVDSDESEKQLLLLQQQQQQQQQTPPSPTSTLSGGEYSDISYNDIKQDNPYSAHHRWQTLRRQAAVQGLGLPGPKTSLDDAAGGLNRDYRGRHSSKIYVPASAASAPPPARPLPLPLELAGTPADDSHLQQPRKFADRQSLASLPQSPMLDLRVIGGPDGDDVDVVPMGYNLGHDLGDFLKWEAEHVYAYSTGDVMM